MLTRLRRACGKRAPAAAATLCQNPTLKGAFLYQRPGLRSRSFFDSKRLGCTAWQQGKMTGRLQRSHAALAARHGLTETVEGQLITCEPASVLPLGQRYFLF